MAAPRSIPLSYATMPPTAPSSEAGPMSKKAWLDR